MRAIAITVVMVGLSATASAQTVADLAGTWRRVEPATSEGPATRISSRELAVTRNGSELQVERQVGPMRTSATYDLNAVSTLTAGLRGQPRTSQARWSEATFVVEETETVTLPDGETATVQVIEQWRVQPDGTLRVEVTSVTSGTTVTRTYTYARSR